MPAADNQWAETTLWAKAMLYTRIATDADRESWLYPFWSALALEFIARTALAHINPVLLADTSTGDVNNLLYALGKAPASQSLKSIGLAEVLTRCERLIPDFTSDNRKFCSGFTGRRNDELHTGNTPFASMKIQEWLPRYYEASQALLNSTTRSLTDLFGNEAPAAEEMIKALHDDAAKQVKQAVNAHRTVWEGKTALERGVAEARATAHAQRDAGHVVACPACACQALITGDQISSRDPVLENGEIIVRATMLPTELTCEACGLRIHGHSQLHATQLGDTYTATNRWDAFEYYGQDYDPDPDFNE